MKFMQLIVRNLFRNKRRTLLTLSSIAVSLFLVATLHTILLALTNPPETPDSALRLLVRHRVSLMNVLPISHRSRIAGLDGVDAVAGMTWFGGRYREHFFANMAVDSDQFFGVYPDIQIAEDQKEAFLADVTGAVAGRALCERFGWKPGDRVFLETTDWPFSVEVTVRGVYDGSSDRGGSLYFHWDYFNESLKEHGEGTGDITGVFAVRVSDAERIAEVSRQIDDLFRNGSYPTRTETEKAFTLSFVSMMGDVQTLIMSVVSVVVFAILLIAANTMTMSIRERTREIGILKALGFRSRHVLGLLLGESLLLCLAGTLAGAMAAKLLYSLVDLSGGGLMTRLEVRPDTLLFCAAIGIGIGIVSAGPPGWRASRRRVTEAIRRVV